MSTGIRYQSGIDAVLVDAKGQRRCKVRVGADGSKFLFDAYAYRSSGPLHFRELKKLEGAGKAANLHEWNATIYNQDGAMKIGH
jgi:hypothetical protein